jgi:hypothetical protein
MKITCYHQDGDKQGIVSARRRKKVLEPEEKRLYFLLLKPG